MSVNPQQTYPTWVPKHIGFPSEGNIASSMLQSCNRYADRVALVCGDEEITYSQLASYSERLAAYLVGECGLSAGDRVAVMMPNLPAYPPSILAILRAGLVVVNVNPLYTPRELSHQLNDSGTKAIIIAEPFLGTLDQVLSETDVETVLIAPMGEALEPIALANEKVRIPLNAALAYKGELPAVDVGPNSVAFLQYTGGTTGPSKGATLSHGNILANQEQLLTWIAPVMNLSANDDPHVIITALPLYHVFALTVNCLAMMPFGATNVLIANPRDLPGLVETWAKHKVTVFTGVNTLFNGLLHTPGFADLDFSTLRFSAGGGAAVQTSVAKQWKEVTKRVITEGYGLSETSPLLTMNSVADEEHSGTVGFAIPSTEVLLLDDNDQPAEEGQPGELCARGPQVMSGYWNRPDANAEVFTDDGFFRTGDVAIRHPNGWLQIVDRKKDMILVSGFNVYPTEIESVSAANPKVLEAACIGIPDEKTGEAIKLFVVRSDDSLTSEELVAYCRENLTAYKVPRHVEFLAELPKSPVGKILRRELRVA